VVEFTKDGSSLICVTTDPLISLRRNQWQTLLNDANLGSFEYLKLSSPQELSVGNSIYFIGEISDEYSATDCNA
jgi:hypothetical protein